MKRSGIMLLVIGGLAAAACLPGPYNKLNLRLTDAGLTTLAAACITDEIMAPVPAKTRDAIGSAAWFSDYTRARADCPAGYACMLVPASAEEVFGALDAEGLDDAAARGRQAVPQCLADRQAQDIIPR
ncbi:MAG: hypothetical protein V2J26_12315 [Pacificimonas sp.]|jgi:hypothetical protein|nr:hypothetical protein [Pacificimonas sp.]